MPVRGPGLRAPEGSAREQRVVARRTSERRRPSPRLHRRPRSAHETAALGKRAAALGTEGRSRESEPRLAFERRAAGVAERLIALTDGLAEAGLRCTPLEGIALVGVACDPVKHGPED